jgi:hypothetical protein
MGRREHAQAGIGSRCFATRRIRAVVLWRIQWLTCEHAVRNYSALLLRCCLQVIVVLSLCSLFRCVALWRAQCSPSIKNLERRESENRSRRCWRKEQRNAEDASPPAQISDHNSCCLYYQGTPGTGRACCIHSHGSRSRVDSGTDSHARKAREYTKWCSGATRRCSSQPGPTCGDTFQLTLCFGRRIPRERLACDGEGWTWNDVAV